MVYLVKQSLRQTDFDQGYLGVTTGVFFFWNDAALTQNNFFYYMNLAIKPTNSITNCFRMFQLSYKIDKFSLGSCCNYFVLSIITGSAEFICKSAKIAIPSTQLTFQIMFLLQK